MPAAPDPVPPAWLRAQIEAAGLTQAQAAALLRVAPRTVRGWLAAEREIPWAAAEALRAYLADEPPDLNQVPRELARGIPSRIT